MRLFLLSLLIVLSPLWAALVRAEIIAPTETEIIPAVDNAHFHIRTEIMVGHHTISNPQFIVLIGEPASVDVRSYQPNAALKMNFVATNSSNPKAPNAIELRLAVKYRSLRSAFRSNPAVYLTPGKRAIVSLGTSGRDKVSLKVIAERM